MQCLNKWLMSICFSVVIVLIQVIVTQYSIISGLRTELSFVKSAHDIAVDQINDVTYHLMRARSDRDEYGNRQFVAGIVSAIDRRDDYSAIWHDGYSRGITTQQYAAELDSKKTIMYTDDKQ